MGGRSTSSGMTSASASQGGSFMSNQQNMEDYAVAVGMFDRDYMRTAEGREALREFMDNEREAGLTEEEMRQAIKDTGSDRDRGTGSSRNRPTATGGVYQVSEIPSRIQSYTYSGSGAAGDWESKMYVTRKGDAIKEVTKFGDGRRMTETIMKNYGTQYDRSRAQFENDLAKMAKARIRAGSKVTSVDGKKKGR